MFKVFVRLDSFDLTCGHRLNYNSQEVLDIAPPESL